MLKEMLEIPLHRLSMALEFRVKRRISLLSLFILSEKENINFLIGR